MGNVELLRRSFGGLILLKFMTTDLIQHTEQIRNLNDRFRKLGDLALGQIVLTSGVQALVGDNDPLVSDRIANLNFRELMGIIASFDSFDEANDPHGEHDFFSFDYKGKKLFMKIDYYDTNLEYGSPNPADPVQTKRVMTIMLSEEY